MQLNQFELTFLKLTEYFHVTNLVEIGAHFPKMSILFLKKGNREAIALEANPYVFNAFNRSVNSDKLKYVLAACSDVNGTTVFKIPKRIIKRKKKILEKLDEIIFKNYHRNLSYHLEITQQAGSILNPIDNRDMEEINVATLTLDTIHKPCSNTALWIDVEGAAGKVIEGSVNNLNSEYIKLVCIELESKTFWDEQIKENQIKEQLYSHGFCELTRDNQDQNQCNVIFIREADKLEVEKIFKIPNIISVDQVPIKSRTKFNLFKLRISSFFRDVSNDFSSDIAL